MSSAPFGRPPPTTCVRNSQTTKPDPHHRHHSAGVCCKPTTARPPDQSHPDNCPTVSTDNWLQFQVLAHQGVTEIGTASVDIASGNDKSDATPRFGGRPEEAG